jgi:hypothetical protein
MALWEQIEPLLERALATRGVQQFALDDDEAVWAAGLAAVDGSLEIRTGTRGAKRGPLRRHRVDRAALEAMAFTEVIDAWALGLEPVPLLARRAAALLEQALTGPLRASPDGCVAVFFEQTGPEPGAAPGAPHLEHLQAAVRVWEQESGIMVAAGRPSRACLDLTLGGGTAQLNVIPPEGLELEIPGFRTDESGWPVCDVPREEAAELADAVLHQELGVRQDEPLFVHFLTGE